MTDNKLKIRIQIPQSSEPKQAHYSIPVGGEKPDKPPFDMQKIFITLFVIFLAISSFGYLVFGDKIEPLLSATKQPNMTQEQPALPPPVELKKELPAENISEPISDPPPVEETFVDPVSQFIGSDSLEIPSVIEEQKTVVPRKKIIAAVKNPTEDIIKPLVDTLPSDQPQVVRAQLTSAIYQREPVDSIDHIRLSQGASKRIHFFMQLRDLANQQVSVHWFFKDKEVEKMNLIVGHELWRTHAYKLLSKTRLGSWHVELHDASGSLLAQRNFSVSNYP